MMAEEHAGMLSVKVEFNGQGGGTVPPGTDLLRVQARLPEALLEAIRRHVPGFEWTLTEPYVGVFGHVIETEAGRETRRIRERQADAERRANAPERIESADGVVGLKHPGGGYSYTREGRDWGYFDRCRMCREFGCYAETGLCPDCEAEPLAAVGLAVRTVAPDATPEQVAEWLRVGQAVERLEGRSFEIMCLPDRTERPQRVILYAPADERGFYEYHGEGAGLTLPDAVAAALGDAP